MRTKILVPRIQLSFLLTALISSVGSVPIELESSQNETADISDNLIRQARQENTVGAVAAAGTGTVGAGTDAGSAGSAAAAATGATENIGYLYSTYANVGQILNGVFEGDIAPILAGGAAFIPAGELRRGVSQLLVRDVAPQVQQIFRNAGQLIQRQFNRTNPEPNPVYSNSNHNAPLPETPSNTQAGNSRPSGGISLPNPLDALRNNLPSSSSSQSGDSPLASIRNRLQSIIPIFGGGGSSNDNKASSNIPSNPLVSNSIPSNPVVSSNIPSNPVVSSNIPSNPVVSSNIPSNPVVNSANGLRHGLPFSPLD